MRYLVAFGRFWYEFIVGDDWRIAAGVTLVLAIGAVLLAAGLGAAWLPPVLAVGFAAVFALPLVVGTRPPATGNAERSSAAGQTPRADQEGAV